MRDLECAGAQDHVTLDKHIFGNPVMPHNQEFRSTLHGSTNFHLHLTLFFQVLVRFGTLLEAFCRGLGPYLKKLIKQTEALDKLTKLTDSLKERFETAPGKERMKFMFESIKKEDYVESMQFFHSPLENTVLLGELDIAQCKSMDSAKKPLWLVWKNPDELADKLHEYNAIIFKNGDDLRQDMLTLQGES